MLVESGLLGLGGMQEVRHLNIMRVIRVKLHCS